MADPRQQLSELAARVDTAVAEGSLATERAVQLRAAEPLVEVLGWDVRGDDVRPEVTLDEATLDYQLEIDGEAAIAVATASPEEDLGGVVEEQLRPMLESGLVPRGIGTDGRRVVLLVRSEATVFEHAFPFDELVDHSEALGRFHRSSIESALADEQAQRRDAARRLAAGREPLEATVREDVVDVTGSEVSDVVSTAVQEFVDDLMDELAPAGVELDGTESVSEASERSVRPDSPGGRDESGNDGDVDAGLDAGSPGTDRAAPDPVSDPTHSREPTDGESTDGEGSYVARFFGGSNSVGAVGTGSPRSTIVGVVRYLLENQDLHRAVTFPWEVEPGEPVVTDSRPAPEWVALENPDVTDVFVRPIDDPRAAKATIEALADAVGLRVMFQGDW